MLCKKVIHGDVKATNRHCGGGRGNVIQIGYQITKKEWITLIEVCYNEVEGSTLYTQHYIFGNTVRGKLSIHSYNPINDALPVFKHPHNYIFLLIF